MSVLTFPQRMIQTYGIRPGQSYQENGAARRHHGPKDAPYQGMGRRTFQACQRFVVVQSEEQRRAALIASLLSQAAIESPDE